MPARSKSIIIFDGSNFYHKLKELNFNKTFNFDYGKFSEQITKGSRLQEKYYCIGKVAAKQNDVKARKMMAKQQSLVTGLQKQGFVIQFGYLLKSNITYHEKGVDIQIATNLLVDAFKDIFTSAYLVSSDSDLLPAIQAVQSIGKRVVYVGFKHKPSYALLRVCKKSMLLTKKDLVDYF